MARRTPGARSARYGRLVVAVARALTLVFDRWRRVSVLTQIASDLVPRVRVATARGAFLFYTPSKAAVYWPRSGYQSEPDTLRWLDAMAPGAVLWDIGASVGIYSMYAARGGVAVYAFEPNPFTFHCLVRNLQENALLGKVKAYCVALAERPELGGFFVESTDAGTVGNAFGDASASTVRADAGPIELPSLALSIDGLVRELGAPVPDHVKIDVDSIEERIVAGGREILSDRRVKSVLIEIVRDTPERAARGDRIVAAMRQLGFAVDPAITSIAGNTLFVRG